MAAFTVVNEAQQVVTGNARTIVQNRGPDSAFLLFGSDGAGVTAATGIELESGGSVTVEKETWAIAGGSGQSCDIRTALT